MLKSPDLGALAHDLEARFGDIQDFFDQDAMVIDLSRLESEAPDGERPRVDFLALIELLKKYRVVPVGVRGGSAEQTAAALAAGLYPAPDARIGKAAPGASIPRCCKPLSSASQPASQPVPQPAAAPTGALVIDKPMRSGQQAYARGRDLVMLAMVNPGAEVIADGHIHVYAPLRGRAIAGARGNTDARISR